MLKRRPPELIILLSRSLPALCHHFQHMAIFELDLDGQTRVEDGI